MIYNAFISTSTRKFNILGVSEEKIQIAVDAYLQGKTTFTISGQTYKLLDVKTFRIFKYETAQPLRETLQYYKNNIHYSKKSVMGNHLPPSTLEKMGTEVTDWFIGNNAYGAKKVVKVRRIRRVALRTFVNPNRIAELTQIKNSKLDTTRLVQLCKEINHNFTHGNYLSVSMLGRSVLNHVPPVFGFNTFNDVVNNYGNQSTKKVFKHLNETMRGIADSFLHDTMRKNESLPNETQINFSQDFDFLLVEVIRAMK